MTPSIICHMLTSVDGKITGAFIDTKAASSVNQEYERTNSWYNPQAWLRYNVK